MATGDPYCKVHGFTPCWCHENRNNMNAYDYIDNPFEYYDEFPQDDPFQTDPALEADSLQYRDEVVQTLQTSVEEYLTFATARDLFKLIADLL